MNESIEIQMLTKTIANLTTVLIETVAASVRGTLLREVTIPPAMFLSRLPI